MPFHLFPDETIGNGLRRIAGEELDVTLLRAADDAVTVDEKVHELRTCCKKMRGLLQLLRPLMGEAFVAENARFREAARHVAADRDAAVLARTIAGLGGTATAGSEIPHAETAQHVAAARRLLAECRRCLDNWPLDLDGFSAVEQGFARSYQKCLNAWNTAQHRRTDELYHRLRRRTKYHWYQLRMLEFVGDERLGARLEALYVLQQMLGEAHDLYVLETCFETEAGDNGELLQRAGSRKAGLYDAALDAGAGVFATGVDELVADLSRYWADRPR